MGVGDSTYFGYGSVLGMAEETTFGTKVTMTSWIEFNSESMKRSIEEMKLESINTTRNFRRRMLMNESVEGSIESYLNLGSDAIMYLVKQAMGGTCSSASQVSGCIAHTFYEGDMESNKSTSGAADVKSLSIQVRKGGSNLWDFKGCRVNNLTIKGEVGSPILITAEIIGKAGTISTDSMPTIVFSDVAPVNFTGVTIKTSDTSTSLTAETFQSFELSINNNLVSDGAARQLGIRTVGILPPTRREVSLKLSQRFDTTSSFSYHLNETKRHITILLDNGQTVGSTALATTYSMLIDLPACYYNSNMPEIGDIGPIQLEHEISCISEPTSTGYAIQITAYNAKAFY